VLWFFEDGKLELLEVDDGDFELAMSARDLEKPVRNR
jgi:hypothetical protein